MEEADGNALYTSTGIMHFQETFTGPMANSKPHWYQFKLKKEYNRLMKQWNRIANSMWDIVVTDELKSDTLKYLDTFRNAGR